MALVKAFRGVSPRLTGAWVAENATLVGDVELGEDANVWYGCVLRGDMGRIRVGQRSNIQDMCCIHMTSDVSDTVIGNEVTVGHSVTIHGAVVEDGALIGMGALLLDNARIGEEAFVGAGSLVTANVVIPPRALVLGRPGKVVRILSAEEAAQGRKSALKYVKFAREHFGPA
ncbi:MAG TPA: gamma carbonic anhydrase family protein [Polyangiaceae bacterium]|nr:gamma carbonic anhydrase family protein [Polyangiaceae bacterium]